MSISEALANLESVRSKYAGKKLLNFGELKEVQDAQSELLIALAQGQT